MPRGMGKVDMTNHESCLHFSVHMASLAHKAMPPLFSVVSLERNSTRLGEDKKVIKPKASHVGVTGHDWHVPGLLKH